MSDARSKILITVDDLARQIGDKAKVTLLDVNNNLASTPLDRPVIPGAIAISLDGDIAGPASKEAGNRPVPDVTALQSNARRWGIDQDSLVVVYDNNGGAQASRAWWTFRWAGFENTRLLDGGLTAWTAAGQETAADPVHPPGGGDVTLSSGYMPTIEADDAAAIGKNGVLLDARGRAAYEGDPDKPATGHIPGAVSAPAAGVLGPDKRFKSSEELAEQFGAMGVDGATPVAAYCGSGTAAASTVAALNLAGIEAPLYVGSWSHWSADPKKPVAQGDS